MYSLTDSFSTMLSSPNDSMIFRAGFFMDMSTENARVGFWVCWIIFNHIFQLERWLALSYWHGYRCENGERPNNFLRFVG